MEARFRGQEIPTEHLLGDIVKHEMSHTFSTPQEGRRSTQQILGTHCTNDPCIMGQVDVPGRPTLLAVARQRRAARFEFCGDCREDLRSYFR